MYVAIGCRSCDLRHNRNLLLGNGVQQARFANIAPSEESDVQPKPFRSCPYHADFSLFFLDKNVTFAAAHLIQHRQCASGLFSIHVLQFNSDELLAGGFRLRAGVVAQILLKR